MQENGEVGQSNMEGSYNVLDNTPRPFWKSACYGMEKEAGNRGGARRKCGGKDGNDARLI
jgi:hypothetical protein